MSIRIAHELPLSLMTKYHFAINDYLYVLLHKLIEDSQYRKAVEKINHEDPGTMYLDNSAYELGEALSNHDLNKWNELLNPGILVLPDTLGDYHKTVKRTFEYLDQYPDTRNGMAVIQGASLEEMLKCYVSFTDDERIGMIGIPFVFKWVEKDPLKQMNERIKLMHILNNEHVDYHKHHLLGCWLASEYVFYRDYDWIYSVDTSNPVMAAIEGNRYEPGIWTLPGKPQMTFDKAFKLKESEINMDTLMYNVRQFRDLVGA